VDFTVRRTAQSPWEYQYNLAFKAWRRITLGIGPASFQAYKPVTRDPNAFAQLLNRLQAARRVLETSRDVLLAAQADTEKLLLEPLREVTLFCKDALGVAVTAADLPYSIASTFRKAAVEASHSMSELRALGRSADATTFQRALKDLGIRSGKTESRGGNVGATGTGTNQDPLTGADPANKSFANPRDNFDGMDLIKPSELNLPPSIQAKITDEKERVRQLNRLDFEKYRDQFVEFQAQFADAVGAGSSAYDSTYNRPTYSSDKTPTGDDFDVLFALNQTVLEMNRLAASSDVDSSQITTVDAVAGMASSAGIAFTVPASKFAVPFPYGMTLEQLAGQYLGDPNRWHEIVALNGLRTPYVDEDGLQPAAAGERQRQPGQRLQRRQPVHRPAGHHQQHQHHPVHSGASPRSSRISSSNYVITVDGEDPGPGSAPWPARASTPSCRTPSTASSSSTSPRRALLRTTASAPRASRG
jgi:hypothetical protein